MTQFTFTKATKEQSKLRLALFGPSGSGKTFTALRLATGLGGKVAFIDTERGSASKYADRFEFDVLELGNGNRTTEGYISAIKAAQQAGYNILIIDSMSHAWKELLTEVDRLTSQFGGNKWAAWSKGTPKQASFVDAILDYDGHIIATMRSKTAWDTSKDSKGRAKPVRVGLEPIQGKDIEYEFDLLGELSIDHVLNIIKDRTGKFQDRTIKNPSEEMGKELAAWLSEGAVPKKRKAKPKTEKPAGKPASAKMMSRWSELTQEATSLGLGVEELSETPTSAEVTKRGKALSARIESKGLENERPKADGETIATIILEGLSENIHSVNGALRHANLSMDTDADIVVDWFRQYRASRDAGADTPEAATVANAWLASRQV